MKEKDVSSTARSAVVTGAGRGIGAAIARRLAGDAYDVVAASRTQAEVAVLAETTPRVSGVVADVAVESEVAALAHKAQALGQLNVWVNNAAILHKTAFQDLTFDEWRATLAVDLDGVFLGCRAAFHCMCETGGAIVNLASLSGVPNVEKFPGLAAYNVSKAGVIALTEAVALEGRPHGIRCFCISPGAVDTDMLRLAAPHLRPGMSPDDVAAIVAWLVSPDAAPLSGTNIPIFSNV
jgi:NAD(P)-dependent dehydrogenase (short-subunit alcohol dehydrogenase family)